VDRRTELAQSVIIGKDDWLFHRDHEAVQQVTGGRPLSDDVLLRSRHQLECRHQWIAARGADYYFFVVPEKHVVYQDKLPGDVLVSDNRPARQLIRELETHASPVSPIYPADALTARRSERETYLLTDTHWNMFGGYVAYRALSDVITRKHRISIVEEPRLEYYRRPLDGDLGTRLEPERSCEALYFSVKEPRGKKVGENRVFTRGSAMVYENDDEALPRAVIFRDSFANWWLPLLAESFSRVVVVSAMEVYFELIESEKPDVVITEVAERYLNFQLSPAGDGYFPNDHSRAPFEALCLSSPEEVARWTSR
jgi:hypothetical protein